MSNSSREPLVHLFMIVRYYRGCRGVHNKALLKTLHKMRARHWKYNGFWVMPLEAAQCPIKYLQVKTGKDSSPLLEQLSQLHDR